MMAAIASIRAQTLSETTVVGATFDAGHLVMPEGSTNLWATLAILNDLGMSDDAIVSYFARFKVRLARREPPAACQFA